MKYKDFFTYMARIETFARRKALEENGFKSEGYDKASWNFSYRDDMLSVGNKLAFISDIIGVKDVSAKDLKIKLKEVCNQLLPWMGIPERSVSEIEFSGAFVSITADGNTYVRSLYELLKVLPDFKAEVDEGNIFPTSFGELDRYLSQFFGVNAFDTRALKIELRDSGFVCIYSKRLALSSVASSAVVKGETVYIYKHKTFGIVVTFSILEAADNRSFINNPTILIPIKGKSLLVDGVLNGWKSADYYYYKKLQHGFSRDLHNVYGVSEYPIADSLVGKFSIAGYALISQSDALSHLGVKIRDGLSDKDILTIPKEVYSSRDLIVMVSVMELRARTADGLSLLYPRDAMLSVYDMCQTAFLSNYSQCKGLLNRCEFIIKKEYGLNTW